jgi:hypothetical protein
MIQQKRLISVTITIICLTTIFSCSTTLGIVTDERGEATIDNIVCTKAGYLIVIYHRDYWSMDIMLDSGPYVRVFKVSEEGSIAEKFSSISVPFSSSINSLGLVQEDNDALRLIGWDGGKLTELWWFKDNQSLEIHNPGTSFTYPYYQCAYVLFPRQVRYTQQVQNYTLIGWSECKDEPVVIVTDGSTTDLINLQNISKGIYYQANAVFIADNSSEAYYAHLISGTNDILIRHLSSNMTLLNETKFTISGTPFTVYGITYFDTLLGLNGDPYVGIRILDPNHETTSDTYQHTFELVNLKKNTSFVLSIPAKDNNYDWNGLVDESGSFHGFFYTDNDGNFIRYVRVNSTGNIELDTTFNPGEKRKTRLDNAPSGGLDGEKIMTFWGDNYIIGAENSGIFLFELSTGTVVISNTEIISFISYRTGMNGAFLFVLVTIVIITIWGRKRFSLVIIKRNM